MPSKPIFFATPSDWRTWLEKNHARVRELWVGFYRKASGKPSITWPESVDEALCFGWIDGLRKGIDESSYTIRFSPRKPGSTWSAVNIRRAAELKKLGRMKEAGLAAFAKRQDEKSAIYSYEQRKTATLDKPAQREFRAHAKAWQFFEAQPAGYRRIVAWWVTSAKKEETRRKRLGLLIEYAERQQRIPMLKPARTQKKPSSLAK